ncbi:DUF882 domain-containing protein [Roseiarcaceae bacterium H3SJ34-1]|uniref:DUF882 domain-containing protein n=1 Tax=Terripilifer ovatus TaxID=3032367 RepID=UPI003AB922A1|nr:DUF882 domain-containing protein [Roseiarcaceae bacterium H3SJ34-1]
MSTTAASGSLAIILTAVLPNSTQTAIANGDTRTINLFYVHTNETISATFRVNGSYDAAVLDRLNWFLRDWRRNEPTKMDPRLFDAIWEAQRGAGSTATIKVMSAYRSPETNSMLRRRSRAVAEHSQHIQGRAMDIHVDDVPMSAIRETAMRMQRGGVGYYPTAGTPFVHIDVGSVRAWPRMNYDQLVRLFPDGKTVHIPSNGQPLARYEEARAEIAARGGEYAPTLAQVKSKGFFATLFGWNEDDEDVAPVQVARRAPEPVRTAAVAPANATAFVGNENANPAAFGSDFGRNNASPAVAAAPPAPATQLRGAPLTIAALDTKYTDVPMPPRRPSEAQVLALIAAAVPLPPQRPTDLIVLAKAETTKAEMSSQPASRPSTTSRDAVAALIGATNSGNVAATPGLPAVITQGAPVVASAGSSMGLLAFAPFQKEAPKPAAARQRNAPIVAHPVSLPVARDAKLTLLVAARLDRSNFAALVAPASISDTPVASLLGSTVAPLRTSARNDLSKIIFAPATPLKAAETTAANLPVQNEDTVAAVATAN